ncbi:MAG: hypothetical protein M0P66_03680 [Salinivirgaceae bacterium]|nr:hypothetical protein [Salinivirgaceae bacterium]
MYDFLNKHDEVLKFLGLLNLFFLSFTWVKGFKYDQAAKKIDKSYNAYHSIEFKRYAGRFHIVFPKYISSNYRDLEVLKYKSKYNFNLICFWISLGLLILSFLIVLLGP